ncbi:MAG: WbqC family protein, partial [Candidatus Hodarchaeota archaeon]
RNKIRTFDGWGWIMTPVLTKGRFKQKIADVMIDNSQPWQRKITSTLTQNYKNALFWSRGGEQLCELINKHWERLVDFNLAVINFFLEKLEINRDYCLASSLETKHTGSQLILEICEKMNTSKYLSGRNGRNYLDQDSFVENGIEVIYQDFKHPFYSQFHGHFMPNMSIVDLYFNHGFESKNIISKKSFLAPVKLME